MTSLSKFELSDTNIGELDTTNFEQLTQLEILYIHNMQWEYKPNIVMGDAGIQFVVNLPKLQTLYLYNQGITDKGAYTLSLSKTISELEITGNYINDEGAIALSQLPSLKSIGLSNNNITDLGAMAFVNLPNVKYLNLGQNKLTDLTAYAFANRTAPMDTLLLYNNHFSAEAINALQSNSNIGHVSAGSPSSSAMVKKFSARMRKNHTLI